MLLRSALAAGLIVCSTAYATEPTATHPRLAPGLWEMKNTMASLGGVVQTIEICIGEDGGDFTEQAAKSSKNCPQKNFRTDGGRVTLDAVCKVEDSLATIHGEFSGDFTTHYNSDILTTYDPPLQGMAKMALKQESRRLGDCKSGQKPGDVVTKNVGGINVEKVLKNLQRMPQN